MEVFLLKSKNLEIFLKLLQSLEFHLCKKFCSINMELLVYSSCNSIVSFNGRHNFWFSFRICSIEVFKFDPVNNFFNQKLLVFFCYFFYSNSIFLVWSNLYLGFPYAFIRLLKQQKSYFEFLKARRSNISWSSIEKLYKKEPIYVSKLFLYENVLGMYAALSFCWDNKKL